MFLGMNLRCVFGMLLTLYGVGPCYVGMVCRFLVAPRLVMRRRFAVMPGCVRMVF
jgi:hypothetical protein